MVSYGSIKVHCGRQGAFDEFEDWSEAILSEEAVRYISWIRKSLRKHAGHIRASAHGANAIRDVFVTCRRCACSGKAGPSQIKELTVNPVKAETGGQVVLEAKDIA